MFGSAIELSLGQTMGALLLSATTVSLDMNSEFRHETRRASHSLDSARRSASGFGDGVVVEMRAATFRTRRKRRQLKQVLRHGKTAKRKHMRIGGRTGQIMEKRVKN